MTSDAAECFKGDPNKINIQLSVIAQIAQTWNIQT